MNLPPLEEMTEKEKMFVHIADQMCEAVDKEPEVQVSLKRTKQAEERAVELKESGYVPEDQAACTYLAFRIGYTEGKEAAMSQLMHEILGQELPESTQEQPPETKIIH